MNELELKIGWNGGKLLQGRGWNLAGEMARVEAHGPDWVVIRTTEKQEACAATFDSPKSLTEMLDILRG